MIGYLTAQNGEEAERIAQINVFGLRDNLQDKSLLQIKIDDDVYSVIAMVNDNNWEFWIAQIIKNHNKVYNTFIEKIYNHESFYKLLKADTAWVV